MKEWRLRLVYALLIMTGLAQPAAAATVTGRVDLLEKNGKPGDTGDVVLYVEGAKPKGKLPAAPPATVLMKGKQFLPRLTVVPVGSTVSFPNQDPIFHNVFSVSGPNRFDLDLYKRPKAGSFTFANPGVVRVYCNIHPQMSAVLFIVDSPFHARATKEGTFTIEDVPPGKYALRAWHERGGEAEIPIEVPPQGTVTVNVRLDASKYKRVPHKNKYGKDYSTSETY